MKTTDKCRSIYKHIGPGERIALSKLAVEHLETTGRPLRLAIDISIWQFQIQSGQGGKNPALRTLYYRLLRLLALSIQPLFVFDGPHKPPFKRGKKIVPGAACLPDFLTKELLKRFGFPYHTALGEAEAECALLQKEGVVDAVLSEDVDTLMFGARLSLRNWSAEGMRGNKSPTHVNVYRAEATKEVAGLDCEGMILVALMSGGDYIPPGVPGCGPKTACEAAKAGFGGDLCRLSKRDEQGLRQWRQRLQHELITNESKYFRQKHKALKIPESFPDMTVLGYYTHPVVSNPAKVSKLREVLQWSQEVNVSDLRLFVAEAFNWTYLGGAKKFIRGLAPALLAHKLIKRSEWTLKNEETLEAKESAEAHLVKAVSDRRSHWNTDGTSELRITYIPNVIVGLDLDAEEVDEYQGYENEGSGDEAPISGGEDARDRSRSPTKRRGPSTYDPTEIEKIWVLETYVKLGVPLLVETWEEDMRNPKKFAARKARAKKGTSKEKAAAKPGAMEQYVKISKPGVSRPTAKPSERKQVEDDALPPVFLAPAIAASARSPQRRAPSKKTGNKQSPNVKPSTTMVATAKAKSTKGSDSSDVLAQQKDFNHNPWTLSRRPSDTFGFKSPTRYSALGIYPPSDPDTITPTMEHASSSKETHSQYPASPPTSPHRTPRKRHSRPTTPISDTELPTNPSNIHHTPIKATPQKPTGLQTPITRDSSKPSPRKKRSPLEIANDLYVAGQLKTPTSLLRHTRLDDLDGDDDDGAEEQLTAKKVNRKIDFSNAKTNADTISTAAVTAILTGQDSPASTSSSLPSPSTFLSPRTTQPSRTITDRTSREQATPSKLHHSSIKQTLASPVKLDPKLSLAETTNKAVRKFVALRESLEGAWRIAEEWEMDASDGRSAHSGGRHRSSVYDGVEVVDLTAP